VTNNKSLYRKGGISAVGRRVWRYQRGNQTIIVL